MIKAKIVIRMDDEFLERMPMLDELSEVLDGMWVVGFNRKTGNPFASAKFNDLACGDALSFLTNPFESGLAKTPERFDAFKLLR